MNYRTRNRPAKNDQLREESTPYRVSGGLPPRQLHCIDLFAGCGGLSLGLEEAGFKPLLFSEINPQAAETYIASAVESGFLPKPSGIPPSLVDLLNAKYCFANNHWQN